MASLAELIKRGAPLNAVHPTAGLGLTLDTNGSLPEAVRKLLPGYVFDRTEYAAEVTISATAVASANTIVTAATLQFDGSTPINIDFWAPYVNVGANASGNQVSLYLFDNGTSIGRAAISSTTANTTLALPIFASRKLTPTAGQHIYSARAIRSNADGAFGSEGSPGFIRITRA